LKSNRLKNKFSLVFGLAISLFISLQTSTVQAGLIGTGGLYDYKVLFSEDDGSTAYRVYCVKKNGVFSISNHHPVKNKAGKWYDILDSGKYLGMTYDGLDINRFGEKACR